MLNIITHLPPAARSLKSPLDPECRACVGRRLRIDKGHGSVTLAKQIFMINKSFILSISMILTSGASPPTSARSSSCRIYADGVKGHFKRLYTVSLLSNVM